MEALAFLYVAGLAITIATGGDAEAYTWAFVAGSATVVLFSYLRRWWW